MLLLLAVRCRRVAWCVDEVTLSSFRSAKFGYADGAQEEVLHDL